MKILIHRPDKWDNPRINKDLLYYPNGYKYQEPERKNEHPLDKIHKYKITSSFVEVER
jgi:hypothetical protein